MVLVVKAALRLLADMQDGLHSGHRVAPPQRFGSQQDAVRPVQNRVGHVRCLRPVRKARTACVHRVHASIHPKS